VPRYSAFDLSWMVQIDRGMFLGPFLLDNSAIDTQEVCQGYRVGYPQPSPSTETAHPGYTAVSSHACESCVLLCIERIRSTLQATVA
jgi:hypothetical protein